jgi:uncharacterized protein (DUF1810 family)
MTLQRFIDAQEGDGTYDIALAEIRAGRKQSHWIWYILPNLRGLGYSETARFYAIDGQAEAFAYYLHPLLGARLTEVAEAIVTVLSAGQTLEGVFGHIDVKKTISCMTLFDAIGTDTAVQDCAHRQRFQAAAQTILAAGESQGLPRCVTTLTVLGM